MTGSLGVVPIAGRGDLPLRTLNGMPLVDHATAALRDAGVEVVSSDEPWPSVRSVLARRWAPLVIHDSLCPLTPPEFIADALHAASDVVVGVRPVTDTVKTVTEDRVGETVDRGDLVSVASPVVLPPPVVAALDGWPDLSDLAALVSSLRVRFPVSLREAPSLGHRVQDTSDLTLLEAVLAGR